MDLAIPRSATAAVVGAVAATGLIAVTAPTAPAPLDLQVPAVQLSAAGFDDVFGLLDTVLTQSQGQITTAISELTSGNLADALWTGTAGALNALIAAPNTAFVGTVDVLLGTPGVTTVFYGTPLPPVDLGEVFTNVQNAASLVATYVSDGLTDLLGGDVQNGLSELVWGLTGAVSFIPWNLFLGPLAVLLAMF